MKYSALIERMTLEEKASLMSGATTWTTKPIQRLGIPGIFLSDGPTGLRKQAGAADQLGLNKSLPATCFPTVAAVTNSWDVKVAEKVGETLGLEAKAKNVSVVLGPGLNIKQNPLCGRNFEYSSEDPYLAGKIAAAYVRGIQSQGVGSCIKHFAMNNQELKRMSIDSVVDERTMREIYLTGFEIAVKEGKPKAVMSAYNSVNGHFCNENPHLLLDILRKDWGFDGVVVTDWGGDNDRIKGIECLNSLEMPSNGGETDREIVKAVKEGRLSEAKLNQCVDYLLDLIFTTSPKQKEQKIDFKANFDVAKDVAKECVVLLKNDNNLLPLKSKTKIGLFGSFAVLPRYQGAGSSIVNPALITNALDWARRSDLSFVGYAQGFKRYGGFSKHLLRKALALAKESDVLVVFLGLDEFSEVEGIDRKTMRLPKNQLELLRVLATTKKKIVTVLSCGCAVELGMVNKYSDAIIYGSLLGEAGAIAIIDVLQGKVNPSGKLAETFPISYSDVPSRRYYPGHEVTAEYREGPFVGYRYYKTKGVKVEFPFGFGLSYTHFDYSNLKVDEKGVTFDLKNVGKMAGKEISQLYISFPTSKIFRPEEELKGFSKTSLEPGEEKEVFIPFDDKTFRYFNTVTNKWEIEKGDYRIIIGSSSTDVRLEAPYRIQGTDAPIPYSPEVLPHYYKADITNVPDREFTALLGRKLPQASFFRFKRNRVLITTNTTMSDLVYAKGWTGRLFGHAVLFGIKLLRGLGLRKTSDTLTMGVANQTVKTISRMTNGAISWEELLGLIDMFNGHFFHGLGKFNQARKQHRKEKKERKKETESAASEAK